jgi:hypothetical protein
LRELQNDDIHCPASTDSQPHLDLVRLSILIASGEHPFPSTLSPSVAMDLASRVRCLRKQQLMRFLAKLVTQDLLNDVQYRSE